MKNQEKLEAHLIETHKDIKKKIELLRTLIQVEKERLSALKLHLDIERLRFAEIVEYIMKNSKFFEQLPQPVPFKY